MLSFLTGFAPYRMLAGILVLLALGALAGASLHKLFADRKYAQLESEYSTARADWNKAAADSARRSQELLEQRVAANERTVKDYEARLAIRDVAVRGLESTRDGLRDTIRRLVSTSCPRENTGAGPATDGAAASLGQLLVEADQLAEDSARAADRLADQVAGLQQYLKTVCIVSP